MSIAIYLRLVSYFREFIDKSDVIQERTMGGDKYISQIRNKRKNAAKTKKSARS